MQEQTKNEFRRALLSLRAVLLPDGPGGGLTERSRENAYDRTNVLIATLEGEPVDLPALGPDA